MNKETTSTIIFPETAVASTNAASVGPYTSDGTLIVTFLSGAQYAYYGVQKKVATDLLHTRSVGRYIDEMLGGYAYERIG